MSKIKVMVVEDENIVAMDIKLSLERLGYDVPAVLSNGHDAIMNAQRFLPDLILMDIKIKGNIDGIETAREIWKTLRIPVIFLTAYADEKTLERAKLAEPFGYILKPFEEKELHTAIEVILRKHRSVQARETYHMEALNASEEKFKLLVESIQDYAIYMLDPKGYVESWNIGAERILGYKIDEIIGKHFSVFYLPDDIEKKHYQFILSEAMANCRYQEEGWRIRKNGSTFIANINVTPLYDRYSKLRGYAIVTRDVTQLRQSEIELKSTKDLLQSIIDFAPVVIYVKDMDGRFMLVNQSFSELVSVPVDQIIGKKDVDFFPSEIAKIFRDNDDQVLRERKDLKKEETVVVNAKEYTYMSVKFPLIDFKGKPYAICGISNNITERKEAEVQKVKLLKELQVALKSREDFMSIASHELKTPLTTLKLRIQMQKKLAEDSDPKAFDSTRINLNTEITLKLLDRLERLVDDMLDISRIRTGKLSIKPEKSDLSEVLENCINRMQSQFEMTTGVQIKFARDKKYILWFDPIRIEQVFTNLLQNALKYGNGKPVEVFLQDKKDSVVVQVKDQGIGISKENLSKIFDRFERAVSANEVSGLGLGLFIGRQIIEAHKGRIWVESKLGSGSSFYFELPKSNIAG